MDRIRRHFNKRRPSTGSMRSASSGNKDNNQFLVILVSDTPEFDQTIMRRFEAEGFNVKYLSFPCTRKNPERDRKDLENRLHEEEDDLEPGERYAVVAYKKPAYLLLSSHHQSNTTTNPLPRLCALVAYYPQPPETLLDRATLVHCEQPLNNSNGISTYAKNSLLPLQIHLAGQQTAELYSDYTVNPDRKRHRCHTFSYPESAVGFAEHQTAAFDRVDAQLAWSRALDCVKRGFRSGGAWTVSDIEIVWEHYWRRVRDGPASGIIDGPGDFFYYMYPGDHEDRGPLVNCVPANITSGDTYTSVENFHADTFFPKGPAQNLRLLTRTVGPDRIVDEALLTFSHTSEIRWLLPGVQPSNQPVCIPIILSAGFCAGGLAQLNIYWDQASVLAQIGVLEDSSKFPVNRGEFESLVS